MLEVLSAALLIAQAPNCAIAVDMREGAVLMRPSCPVNNSHTRATLQKILAEAKENELRLSFNRIELYPWLSSMLARQASSSRIWDPVHGTARGESDNSYVATALRSMPEFRALFGTWDIAGIAVEKVLRKRAGELSLPAGNPLPPDSLLPYDAILWVTLKRPQ